MLKSLPCLASRRRRPQLLLHHPLLPSPQRRQPLVPLRPQRQRQQKYRIWVDRTPDRIFVIYARCTHLGCTPDWKPSENKFKCPCHGSGYDSEGVNFEGPAPRPMDRAHVEEAPDGQILVDVSKLYQWPKGQPSQFDDDGAFLPG